MDMNLTGFGNGTVSQWVHPVCVVVFTEGLSLFAEEAQLGDRCGVHMDVDFLLFHLTWAKVMNQLYSLVLVHDKLNT